MSPVYCSRNELLLKVIVALSTGEIPWSDNLYVQSKSATAFDVVTVSLQSV